MNLNLFHRNFQENDEQEEKDDDDGEKFIQKNLKKNSNVLSSIRIQRQWIKFRLVHSFLTIDSNEKLIQKKILVLPKRSNYV